MFNKVLIANRGDIAVSMIRSCKELGIKTVAVYSSADMESLHISLADESYCIGPADPMKSYCNADVITCTAINCGADAVYVGYGFLAESIPLIEKCKAAGITCIGPDTAIIEFLSDKSAVKNLMRELAVPTNMNRLHGAPKEIDIQLIGDSSGALYVIGDRDSSYINNTTRLMGESPAYAVSDKTRKKLYKAAKKIAGALNFVGVGSINFYVDREGNHVFKQFVPRLQVGCAITETQCRINLTKWQIRIAAGETLSFSDEDLFLAGCTLGCRIYAVNPANDMPQTGEVSILHIPCGLGVRIETAVYQNCTLPLEYEPILAKVIVHAGNREEAIIKMKNALSELVTEGVINNSELFIDFLNTEEFQSGDYDITSYSKLLSKRTDY
ncbi:MAG: hypothetical protein IKL36_00060 [Clostridia bacterium]|nr:hypothetical protein [Clostridia bacterium]